MKQKKHLKPDVVLKEYWRRNERFADLFNQVFFQGAKALHPEDLTDKDTEMSSVIMEKEKVTALSGTRDLVKQYRKGVDLVLIGIENQMKVHYGMPVRTMLYEAVDYTRQCRELEQKHRRERDLESSDEFLSGIAKNDRIKGAVSLVIYYGEKEWDGPAALSDMMEVPELFASFFNDHRIHLLQVKETERYHFAEKDNQDFFTLLREFYQNQKKIDLDIFRKKYAEMEIYWETLAALGAATGTEKLVELAFENEGGRLNMCTALENLKEEGRLEGIEEGRLEGIEEGRLEAIQDFVGIFRELGISNEVILEKIQEKFHLEKGKALEILN